MAKNGSTERSGDGMREDEEAAPDSNWLDRYPQFAIVWTLPVALRASSLLIATLAVALTPLGWWLSGAVFLGEPRAASQEFQMFFTESAAPASPPPRPVVLQSPVSATANQYSTETRPVGLDGISVGGYVAHALRLIANPLSEGIGRPVKRLFGPLAWLFGGESLSLYQWLYLAGGSVWMFALWSFCGAILARKTVLRIGLGREASTLEAIADILPRSRALFMLPKVPLIILVMVLVVGGSAGLLTRSNWGVFLAGIGWPLITLVGLFLAAGLILLVPVSLFMITAVVAEQSCDEFEAFSRGLSYSSQRLLWLLLYTLAAIVVGTFGAWCIDAFLDLVLRSVGWLVSVGVGAERYHEVFSPGYVASRLYGAQIIGFFEWLVALMADGFRYAFLFCGGATLYLRFRLLVDETEIDEIHEPSQLPNVAPDPLRRQLDELTSGDRKDPS